MLRLVFFRSHSLSFFKNRTEQGYPLGIVPETIQVEPSPVDRELILSLVPKLNYNAVLQAVQELRPHCDDTTLPTLPATLPDDINDNEPLIQDLHLVLMDVHVRQGYLVCPATQRKFPIKEGIPNMILHEDEV